MFSRGCRENWVALHYQEENAVGMHDAVREKTQPNTKPNKKRKQKTHKTSEVRR